MSSPKKKIYMVDDDESVCRSFKLLLGTFDFDVQTFHSAKSFFDGVPADDTTCLLLDIHMPDMDGWATQKQIMASGSKRRVIFISAEKPDLALDRALKAGAVGFMQKPIDGQALVHLINTLTANPQPGGP